MDDKHFQAEMIWEDLRDRKDIPKVSMSSTREEWMRHQNYMNDLAETLKKSIGKGNVE